MIGFNNNKALGLDIGQAAVKAIVLDRVGKKTLLLDSGILDCRSEGILDKEELCRELGPWFESKGWSGLEVVVGVPQYLASTQSTDFPQSSDKNLEEMVSFETRNLAGLSEEAFTFHYDQMSGPPEGPNPVLIGFCRESVIRNSIASLAPADIQIADFAIAGIALANAYVQLYEKDADKETPQLILDIGAESSTLVVIVGGNIRFTGSLMFGTERYAQLVSQQLNVSLEEAERQISENGIAPGERGSAFVAAMQPLENEIHTALENWRAQESAELARLQFSAVCLCGGGASIRGLDALLGRIFGCPARVVGVRLSEQTAPDPSLMGAYGLALQGIGAARFDISLALKQISWRARRRRRFAYLAAAAVLAACLVVAAGARAYFTLGWQQTELEARLADLEKCNAIVPDLENVIQSINHHQLMLLPFAEKGNHAWRFHSAIRQLAEARSSMIASASALPGAEGGEGWVIYLADQVSFQTGKDREDSPAAGSVASTAPTTFRPLLSPAAPPAVTSSSGRLLVTDIKPWKGLVAAVYTATDAKEPYQLVRNFIAELNRTELFAGVDLMEEPESAGREDIFVPWQKMESMIPNNHRRFFLKLPFQTVDVTLPDKPTEK